MSTIPEPIKTWHRIALERRGDEIAGLLADDVIFESPVVFKPQEGRAITEKYLRAALVVLNGPHFKYAGEWYGENSAVLEFVTEIDGVSINGVDIISWSTSGLITHFKVMIRPLKAINAVHQKMAEQLMGGKA